MVRTDTEGTILGNGTTTTPRESLASGSPLVQWLLMSGLVCFGFAAAASLAVAAKLWSMGHVEEGLLFRLVVKGLFFGALTTGYCFLVRRFGSSSASGDSGARDVAEAPKWLFGLVVALLLSVSYPMLSEYPWTAPDELHHLVVARNLAVHSAYASGNPEAGFRYFDFFDSVGPSVLGPVAGAFKVLSPTIPVARVVMATYLFGLALGIFVLVKDLWGARAAAISVGISVLSFGTIYLGRSLYGEVPALMFLVWSMVCWGRSFDSARPAKLLFAAGALWGLGVLAKTFLFLSAFAIIGVWTYDRLTTRRISLRHVIIPALGGIVVLGSWSAVTAYFSYLVVGDVSTLFLYRHYLMFGIPSSTSALEWFLSQPIYSLSLVALLLYGVSRIFTRVSNPAIQVLLMTSQLYCFWWIFFTPGTIFRYMWYSTAILAIFSGPLVLACIRAWRVDGVAVQRRAACALILAVLFLPCAARLAEQLDLIYVQDQAADERHLAEYVKLLPKEALIVSAYWPAGLSMDFMAGRQIDGVEDASQIDDKYDVVIYNTDYNSVDPDLLAQTHRIGRYAILHND